MPDEWQTSVLAPIFQVQNKKKEKLQRMQESKAVIA